LFAGALNTTAGATTDFGYFSITSTTSRGYTAIARTGVVRFVRRDATVNVAVNVSYSGSLAKLATTIFSASGERSVNGSTVNIDSTVLTLPPMESLSIGYNNVVGTPATNYLNGHIQRIAYYPRRLSNAELQSITS
jgi:hypothetical protein